MNIDIRIPLGADEETGQDQQLRFSSLTVNETGFVSMACSVDLLDLKGNVLVKNHRPFPIEYHAVPRYSGPTEIPADEPNEKINTLVSGIKALLTDYLTDLQDEE